MKKVLLVVYDNGSYISFFPLGLAYIAAVLLKEGYEVEIYNQDIHHYPDEHLTEYLNNNKFDFIGVSVIGGYYQYRKLLSLSEAINRSRNRPFYIIGGHGPSPDPDYFLKKTQADAVVMGEGEETIVDLLKAVENKGALSNVLGIAYRDGKEVFINERRPLIQDIDSIPFPAYHIFPMNYYRLMRQPNASGTVFSLHILSSRGCPFTCNFCYRMDEGIRMRSNKNIIEEIEMLKKDYGITYISFEDELLMSSADRSISLCEDFIKSNMNILWSCNGRLNYAQPKVLNLMKKAGCVFINYGIEAMDDEVLRKMNKKLTTKQITEGLDATLEAGISPGLNILFGHIGDSKETLNKGIELLLKYDDQAQMRTIRPVTPYPGSPLYYHAVEKGYIKNCEDFYENVHLNSDLMAVNFTDMSDDEYYNCLLDANVKLIKNYFRKNEVSYVDQARELYLNRNVSFRGFRQT